MGSVREAKLAAVAEQAAYVLEMLRQRRWTVINQAQRPIVLRWEVWQIDFADVVGA